MMKRFSYNIFLLLFVLLSYNSDAQNWSLYVSDAGNWSKGPWQILQYDSSGGRPRVFIKDSLAWPQDILFLDKKNVLISNLSSGKINIHDANTGKYIKTFAKDINGPTRMKIGPDSLLYVLQWGGDYKIRRYDLKGKFIDYFSEQGVEKSIGLDWDAEGNLYVSSYSLDGIRKFDKKGKDLGWFIEKNLEGPTNIWFTKHALLVADYDGGSIKEFDLKGNYLGLFAADLKQCEGVVYLPNGHFLIGNGGNGAVYEYDAKGERVNTFINEHAGGLIRPNGLCIRFY